MSRRTVSAACLLVAAAGLSAPAAGRAARQHAGEYSRTDIVRGSQLYTAQCASCHGLAGNAVAGIDLRRGRFRSAVADDDLKRVIRSGVPVAGMPPAALDDDDLTAIVAFIRAGMDAGGSALTVKVGDVSRGRAIVFGKGDCLSCHRIHDEGARSAPDLSDVGSARSPASIHLSLIEPDKSMLPSNRPIRAVTIDGEIITGRRLNEDTYTVQVADEQGRLRSLLKADLREYRVFVTSPMPSYKDRLTDDEIADVFAYLLSLKDPATLPPRGGRGGQVMLRRPIR